MANMLERSKQSVINIKITDENPDQVTVEELLNHPDFEMNDDGWFALAEIEGEPVVVFGDGELTSENTTLQYLYI